MTRMTRHTLTSASALKAECETIAAQGYACDREEFIAGLVAVAVPVTNAEGGVRAAIAIHGPTARLSLADALAALPALRRPLSGTDACLPPFFGSIGMRRASTTLALLSASVFVRFTSPCRSAFCMLYANPPPNCWRPFVGSSVVVIGVTVFAGDPALVVRLVQAAYAYLQKFGIGCVLVVLDELGRDDRRQPQGALPNAPKRSGQVLFHGMAARRLARVVARHSRFLLPTAQTCGADAWRLQAGRGTHGRPRSPHPSLGNGPGAVRPRGQSLISHLKCCADLRGDPAIGTTASIQGRGFFARRGD
jgi:hypothetical protein